MPQPTKREIPGLTPKERQVLDLIADGLTPKQIAYRIDKQYRTVTTRIRKACDSLEASTPAQAVLKARELGLIGGSR